VGAGPPFLTLLRPSKLLMSRALKPFLLLFLFLAGLTPLAAEGVDPSAAKLVDFGHGWAITNAVLPLFLPKAKR
jgi:hypothetical protein